jgi:hypothetical protein
MTTEAQIRRLEKHVDDLHQSVSSLSERVFLAPISRWSPRDIVAHLVGWNRYLVEGAQQIRRGELPFYDVDPGDNYCKVNAVLVRRYFSTNREELLENLRATAHELTQFVRSLDPSEWDRDYGVRHAGSTITIRIGVDDLIDDYAHHREQIEKRRDAMELGE